MILNFSTGLFFLIFEKKIKSKIFNLIFLTSVKSVAQPSEN